MQSKYQSQYSHGIMFHHFHGNNTRPSGLGSLTEEMFEKILAHIGMENILDPKEWLKHLASNTLKETNICLTFDDALKSQMAIALPILEKNNLTAFWFVYSSVFQGTKEKFEVYRKFMIQYFESFSEFFERFYALYIGNGYPTVDNFTHSKQILEKKTSFPFYTTEEVIFRIIRDTVLNARNYMLIMDKIIEETGVTLDELSRDLWMTNDDLVYLTENDHFIGLHGNEHLMTMGEQTYNDQFEQFSINYKHLFGVTNIAPLTASYPNNSYNLDTINILKHFNIVCAFRANMDRVSQSDFDHYAIPRMDASIISTQLKEVLAT